LSFNHQGHKGKRRGRGGFKFPEKFKMVFKAISFLTSQSIDQNPIDRFGLG
jgi:hypothetical protein